MRKGNRKKHNYPDSDKSLPLRICPNCSRLEYGWNYIERVMKCKFCGYMNDKKFISHGNNFGLENDL